MPKDVILILGCGRSGTSALTRVLSLSGCAVPEKMLSGLEWNKKGCWEPIDAWRMNTRFMFRHGTLLTDPSMRFQEGQLDLQAREDFINEIVNFLNGCLRGHALVIKEPNITVLLEFWLDAIKRLGMSAKVVIALRHPQEVYASFAAVGKRRGWIPSQELVGAFWLKLNLMAERSSRGIPRVVVQYTRLLADWRREVTRISNCLCIPLELREREINEFLSQDLYRQRSACAEVMDTFGEPWVSGVYKVLSSLACDEPIDSAVMNRIYSAYCRTELSFRVAHDEFRERFSQMNAQQFEEFLQSAHAWREGHDF